ncbi:phenylacetaldoxime dehydratase family protein [Variovorax sp. PAMC28562]|uniref:phenylacetaldoxime dehydratase family protein n=1 Tax=Variovorax sp. PAMC28562 TaxID=2762323 RepID=UPI00164DC3B8|nr:phenylacetaldoxime dehydratase family protein [Variovorax sp. PAMC28562]QNK73593.1 phenylacetaldoxime dehydratase family protein [Variovorax sp. PAMC28562]
MESAIAEHLKCPRTRHRRVEDDYAPPYPVWSARAAPSVTQVVMGYFGVQSRGVAMQGKACAALMKIAAGFALADGPGHHDLTHYVDTDGFDNMIAIAYWNDTASHARWCATPAIDAWWYDDARLTEGLGYFREIASPRVEHYETMFNTPDRFEGVGMVMGELSGELQEHGYWGSMRDRIPLSQTDAMSPSGSRAIVTGAPLPGQRVQVAGHQNIAMIRSGQEWADTAGTERTMYVEEMEPVLREGMDFLRDRGLSIGCYSNRYMTHLDAAGAPLQKSFGLSYWRSLADMERWAESHPTHVAIFGGFMRYVQALEFQVKLRVYHEVSVLKADEQRYEYINCHARTGLMNGLQHAS